jgi:predicted alpha/beta hydrolase family esterase
MLQFLIFFCCFSNELAVIVPMNKAQVVLVGHSVGGMALTYMSEIFSKNISVAVYLSATMQGVGGNMLVTVISCNNPLKCYDYDQRI